MNPNLTFSILKMTVNLNYMYRKEIDIRWDWIIIQLRKIEQNTNPDLWLHAPDYVAKFEMKVNTCANEPKYYVDHCPIEEN
jgi:hypothetical protein